MVCLSKDMHDVYISLHETRIATYVGAGDWGWLVSVVLLGLRFAVWLGGLMMK